MRGRFRRAGLALPFAVAAVAAGCGSSQTSSQTGASTAAAPGIAGCHGSDLTATYARSDGATGHMELTIALHNVSRSACRVQGYPRAALLDAAGRRLPLHVKQGSGFFPDTRGTPHSIVMAPGGAAHFGIGFATNNEYAHAHACHTAAAALAGVPGAAGWQRVSLSRAPRVSPCGSTLTVSPVHA